MQSFKFRFALFMVICLGLAALYPKLGGAIALGMFGILLSIFVLRLKGEL